MRPVVIASLLVVLVAAGVAFAVDGLPSVGGEGRTDYYVELDNAFGLIEGADLKIAGVRAGVITNMELDRSDMRAKIGVRVNRNGFGDLRKDAFCETRPQSLIGEYFLDCKPGTAKERLPKGGTIPVEQTGSTIPVDLVNNIMRRPYRERFSILLTELGAGLAARGPDLNETIRRANPALREVDKVLAILAEQRRTIRDLYQDADRVVGRLADSRTEVTRFVDEARDTAATVATRDENLKDQYRTFPTFLRELRPTMKLLGDAADRQAPALRRLRENAGHAERLFRTLGPFAEVSQPAFRTLAGAARQGRETVRDATPRIPELAAFAKPLPEAATNLAISLEHLDDPRFAVDKDPRAGRPDGGYTGLEALMRYIWAQSQAINLFDGNSYFLKVSPFLDRQCASYADEKTVKAEGNERCLAWLGPNQPGITTPDPTNTEPAPAARAKKRAKTKRTRRAERPREERPAESRGDEKREERKDRKDDGPVALPEEVRGILEDILPGEVPQLPPTPQLPKDLPQVPEAGTLDRGQAENVLDFLLGS
jgi:virulence factor Mce-like protein